MEALHQAVEFKPKHTKGTDVVKVDQPFQKTDPSHVMASGMAHLFRSTADRAFEQHELLFHIHRRDQAQHLQDQKMLR